jgi:hypothetical protein
MATRRSRARTAYVRWYDDLRVARTPPWTDADAMDAVRHEYGDVAPGAIAPRDWRNVAARRGPADLSSEFQRAPPPLVEGASPFIVMPHSLVVGALDRVFAARLPVGVEGGRVLIADMLRREDAYAPGPSEFAIHRAAQALLFGTRTTIHVPGATWVQVYELLLMKTRPDDEVPMALGDARVVAIEAVCLLASRYMDVADVGPTLFAWIVLGAVQDIGVPGGTMAARARGIENVLSKSWDAMMTAGDARMQRSGHGIGRWIARYVAARVQWHTERLALIPSYELFMHYVCDACIDLLAVQLVTTARAEALGNGVPVRPFGATAATWEECARRLRAFFGQDWDDIAPP